MLAMPAPLFLVVGEVEEHVAEAGWDQPPHLFALVDTAQLLRAEPQLATTMGLVAAATHPERREVRMVVGVVRDGSRECVLRLRGADGQPDERLSGPDLAPALAEALLATLDEPSGAARR